MSMCRANTWFGILVLGFLGLAVTAEAKVVYVAKTGDDGNDGLSWTTAKVTVQAGLDTALSGDQVWVAAGTYVERITLKAEAGLYGGFIGGEADLTQRDWKANPAILDGNKGGSVVTAPSGATATTRIDGFIIRNGKASSGGGIYCSSSSPTISNNTITGNSSTQSSSYNGGGGILCAGGSPMITNNTIMGNSVTGGGSYGGGGGILCSGGSATITNNTITGNSVAQGATSSGGGGIFCRSGSPTIINNVVRGNNAGSGGAIYCYSSSDPTIANNTIRENTASSGGAIYCDSSAPTISNNTVTGNGAISGGGIYCKSSAPKITNTIIAFNTSGIYVSGSGTPALRYNCIHGNLAYNSSGVTIPTGASGNILVDPQVLAVDYGEMHLKASSPCVDAGDDAAAQPGWVDMDGEPRPQGTHVDIGADEFNGTQPPFMPRIVRISPFGNDRNDGSSWELAKRTVQAGIDATTGAEGGDVWVAAGTYTERITLGVFFHVYGGFAGTENTRGKRDRIANATILDGNASGSVVTTSFGSTLSVLDGFVIRNGKAPSGGGIQCFCSSPTINNNTITKNSATGTGSTTSGGGVYCYFSSPVITDNTITDNSVAGTRVSSGGGIDIEATSSPLIMNNTITANRLIAVSGSDMWGGGICCIGCSPIIVNNLIAGNTASTGGGVYCLAAPSPTISDNTIVRNMASTDGGGVYCYGSSARITNTIIAHNSSGVYRASSGTLTLRSNCVFDNAAYSYSGVTDPTGTNGNISVPPGFVQAPSPGADGKWATADDDLGDLHLAGGSPCIDSGDNAGVPTGILTDLNGLPRFFNDPAAPDTGLGAAPIVDIGAYEYIPGDFDRDGDVDADDLTVFAACVSGPAISYTGDCTRADFDRDGDVDQSDFGLLQRCFSGSGKPVDPACAN